jgi:hypothetical protein
MRTFVANPVVTTTVHNPAAATQATATLAAVTGRRRQCVGIIASIACGATAQTPLHVYLRDGLTGAGAIIGSAVLAAPANGVGVVPLLGLAIAGTTGNAMTLEFEAAGVAASVQSVTLLTIDIVEGTTPS